VIQKLGIAHLDRGTVLEPGLFDLPVVDVGALTAYVLKIEV
jgi:hypothetical protein